MKARMPRPLALKGCLLRRAACRRPILWATSFWQAQEEA